MHGNQSGIKTSDTIQSFNNTLSSWKSSRWFFRREHFHDELHSRLQLVSFINICEMKFYGFWRKAKLLRNLLIRHPLTNVVHNFVFCFCCDNNFVHSFPLNCQVSGQVATPAIAQGRWYYFNHGRRLFAPTASPACLQ